MAVSLPSPPRSTSLGGKPSPSSMVPCRTTCCPLLPLLSYLQLLQHLEGQELLPKIIPTLDND